jgi:hypothetical protein
MDMLRRSVGQPLQQLWRMGDGGDAHIKLDSTFKMPGTKCLPPRGSFTSDLGLQMLKPLHKGKLESIAGVKSMISTSLGQLLVANG